MLDLTYFIAVIVVILLVLQSEPKQHFRPVGKHQNSHHPSFTVVIFTLTLACLLVALSLSI
ncbi:hypothetical protein PMI41_03242 [Phyllobacterium sp. YR531]|nr:hypothetical protein PMI41_03242 [Phyllobacterium sp. YR531]